MYLIGNCELISGRIRFFYARMVRLYILKGFHDANLPGLHTNYTSGKPVYSPYTHSARCTDVSDSDPLLVNVLQRSVDKQTRYNLL